MSAKIFSHFSPLPSPFPFSPRFLAALAAPLPPPPCGFIWPVNSRGTIYTPDRFRSYHLLSIASDHLLSIPPFPSHSLPLSLSIFLFPAHFAKPTLLLPSPPSQSDILHLPSVPLLFIFPLAADMLHGQNAPRKTRIRRARASPD